MDAKRGPSTEVAVVKEFQVVNILHPHGMVERMNERFRRPRAVEGYGRRKEGSPKDQRTLKIAKENDRRDSSRPQDEPLRGRLFDLNA